MDRSESEIRIVDISLLPEWRNHGIGSALLAKVFDESDSGGQWVTLHVAIGSPARRLYERLDFSIVDHEGPHIFMKRCPNRVQEAAVSARPALS